jgi:hypothetical protein
MYELEEGKGRMTVDASGDEIIGQLFDVGSRADGVFEAWDSFATVRYVTDNQAQGTGFKASFSCYPRPQNPACNDGGGLTMFGTDEPLDITTFSLTPDEHPLGRRNYARDLTCTWKFGCPSGMRPQLSFVDRNTSDGGSLLVETTEGLTNARKSVALAANTGGEPRYVQKVATTTPHKN